MKNSHFIIGINLVGILLLSGCGKPGETAASTKKEEVIPVKIIALNKTEVKESIYSSGQFTTNDETVLSFKTGGVIDRIFVREGDHIQKGQLLATLNLTEISAQVNQAQIAFDKAARDYKRAENLIRDSVATLEQFQNSRTGFEIAQQQLNSAKFNMAYSEIRAMQEGVILKKMTNEGQIVGPGMPVLQMSSKGQTDWILRVAVSDKEWARTNINDKVKVQIEALNFNEVEGYVFTKGANADQMTGSFTMDIKLNNARKLNIASGMFGKAEIEVSKKNNLWQIPYEALLDGNANGGFVFVTNNNRKAIKVPVTILAIDKNIVQISEGLANYNSLIVSGSAYLTDNSTIEVVNK